MSTPSLNMGFPISIIGTDSGLAWEQNLNFALTIIDGHTHQSGSGVPITPGAININAPLPFSNFPITGLNYLNFGISSGQPNLSLYTNGTDLFYQDGNGNAFPITTGGAVVASSSGISSGDDTASFVSNTLVVTSSATGPLNIKFGSALLGNSGGSTFLTLQPPTLSGNYALTLPISNAGNPTALLSMNTSNNMGYVTPDGSTLGISGSTLGVLAAGITATQISSAALASGGALSGGSGTPISVDVDGSTIQINGSDQLSVYGGNGIPNSGLQALNSASGATSGTVLTKSRGVPAIVVVGSSGSAAYVTLTTGTVATITLKKAPNTGGSTTLGIWQFSNATPNTIEMPLSLIAFDSGDGLASSVTYSITTSASSGSIATTGGAITVYEFYFGG